MRVRLLDPQNTIESVEPCDDPSCHDLDDEDGHKPVVGRLAAWVQQRRTRRPGTPASPPSRSQIGRACWYFLHTAAANFPAAPTEDEQQKMCKFVWAFAQLYPCSVCRAGFIKVLQCDPPDPTSRDKFTLWSCNAHNAVNEELGQPQYPCNLSELLALYQNIS